MPPKSQEAFQEHAEKTLFYLPLSDGGLWGKALMVSGTVFLVCLRKLPKGPFSSQLFQKPQTHLDSHLELILHYY